MGTFLGHFTPGFFFLSFGLWWAVNVIVRFCRHKYTKVPFKTQATYPFPCMCCGKCKLWPLEGIVKIVATSVGAVGEIIVGSQDSRGFPLGDMQHIVMYSFFGLSGVIDILVYNEFALPEGTDFASLIIAIVVELVLFLFHPHEHNPLEVHVHMLLVYTLVVTVFIILLQMKYRNDPLPALCTSIIFTVQGTWFIQVGQIQHNPIPGVTPLNVHDPESIMITTIYFAMHIGGVFTFYLVLCLLIGYGYRRRYGLKSLETSDSVAMEQLISKDQNYQTLSQLQLDESEDDT